jgi:hypothetical protein
MILEKIKIKKNFFSIFCKDQNNGYNDPQFTGRSESGKLGKNFFPGATAGCSDRENNVRSLS